MTAKHVYIHTKIEVGLMKKVTLKAAQLGIHKFHVLNAAIKEGIVDRKPTAKKSATKKISTKKTTKKSC